MDLLGIAATALQRGADPECTQQKDSKRPQGHHQGRGRCSWLNLDVLAYLDPNISVTIIENGKAVRKEQPKPPSVW